VDTFLTDAGAWLEAREAEHNLMLGICSTIRDDPAVYPRPTYFATVTSDGGTVAAAVRTPPWPLILSEADDPAALDAIGADVADALDGEALSGVVGPPALARIFADAWVAAHGGTWEVRLEERIFQLEAVVPPRSTEGAMRPASSADRELVARWVVAFAREALPVSDQEQQAEAVDAGTEMAGRTFYLWEAPDPSGVLRPVSLTGVTGPTAHGIRIGPVYTPPAFRGRGYASALVARVSQAQLDAGRRFCFLYTDLANPTSNKIYQAIGYRPVTAALRIHFPRETTPTY
jgi:predicted GNAT family acetyltransferase